MTASEAKRDCAGRLARAGIPFGKLTARTVGFSDLARGGCVYVTVHGATLVKDVGFREVREGIPKPSEGGYIVEMGQLCEWKETV